MEPSSCPAKKMGQEQQKKRGIEKVKCESQSGRASNFCFLYMPILWELICSIRKEKLEVLYSVLISIDSILGSFGSFWPGGD